MLGGYEQKPDVGDTFLDENDCFATIEAIYEYDENEGAWHVRSQEAGDVYLQPNPDQISDEDAWVQVG